MTLTDAERRFLARHERGHLATIGRDGIPQLKPLGFSYNATRETIDITGWRMADSAKYRNVQANPVDPDHPGFQARDIGPAGHAESA